MNAGKSYIASCHARALLHTADCGEAQIRRDDSQIIIKALGDHIRITGLGMSYFDHAIVGFTLRELEKHGQT